MATVEYSLPLMTMPLPSSYCTACHQDKPITAFSPRPERKKGIRSKCKLCSTQISSTAQKLRRQQKPEAVRAAERRLPSKQPETAAFRRAQWQDIPKRCPQCHITKLRCEFSHQATAYDGHHAHCKCCATLARQARRLIDPVAIRAAERAVSSKNPATADERRTQWDALPKYCPRCEATKPRTQFFQSNHAYDGYASICKACNKQGSKQRYATNPDKAKTKRKVRYHLNPTQQKHANTQWRHANPSKALAQIRRANSRRRARLAAVTLIETFANEEIFERDGWLCQLCHQRVNKTLKYPDPKSASLDHVIPLAEGGNHSRQNCVLAHLGCNSAKQARHAVQQQRLF